MKYYILRYSGPFGFIKPWTAVRDASGGETYSQQFLTPSIIEGLRQKLEVTAILRHKLVYGGIDIQQEMVQAKAHLHYGTGKYVASLPFPRLPYCQKPV